jgi:hypothetical protein
MYVVRHHHPRTKFVKVPLVRSNQDGPSHEIRYTRVLEPQRPRCGPIQDTIFGDESMAGENAAICGGTRA